LLTLCEAEAFLALLLLSAALLAEAEALAALFTAAELAAFRTAGLLPDFEPSVAEMSGDGLETGESVLNCIFTAGSFAEPPTDDRADTVDLAGERRSGRAVLGAV